MNPVLASDIPLGDLQLYDNYIPQLVAGTWTVQVTQTLKHNGKSVNDEPLGATQEFFVSAPQFSLDQNQVLNQYPPSGSAGGYANVLPHVVLNDPVLPWERKLSNTGGQTPWVALMVFEDAELIGGENNNTHSLNTTVGNFLKMGGTTLIPEVVKGGDIEDDTPCSYIQIPVSVFASIVPRLDELPFLTHCRQVNTSDKAVMGLNERGLFSVVLSNRFPSAPAAGSSEPVKNIVHLVALEGMAKYLAADVSFGNYQNVALISLASWFFYSLPDVSEDFRGLFLNIVKSETDPVSQKIEPDRLWLKLPDPDINGDGAATEVKKRIADGYAPLPYLTRTGEKSFAWYRGPLAPIIPTVIEREEPFFTADAAMIYHKDFGIFDLSLTVAWNAGRAAALSDKLFIRQLFDLRRRAHNQIDVQHHRFRSGHFRETQTGALNMTTTIQEQFMAMLSGQLFKDINSNQVSQSVPMSKDTDAVHSSDHLVNIRKFMSNPQVRQGMPITLQEDLAPVAQWLSRLKLLYPIPFDCLVPDERMLPVESLRFFYIDMNWLDALLDGALSIGMESSRQTDFHKYMKETLRSSALNAMTSHRAKLRGTVSDGPPAAPGVMCGCLLRSALVSGWPNMSVRPLDQLGTMLPILRMDHLSPNILFCIFDGVPAQVEFSEPQEGFGFGADDDGYIVLRKTVKGATPVGRQIGNLFSLRGETQKNYFRSGTRVLNLAPQSGTGLIKSLVSALGAAGSAIDTLRPAAFAMQLFKSPEAIIFKCQ